MEDGWDKFYRCVVEETIKQVYDRLDRFRVSLGDWLYGQLNWPTDDWQQQLDLLVEHTRYYGLIIEPECVQTLHDLVEARVNHTGAFAVLAAGGADVPIKVAVNVAVNDSTATVAAAAGPTAGVADETESAERAAAGEQSKGQIKSDADDASRATSDARYNREQQPTAAIGSGINQDPVGFAGDPSNLYRYAGNSPPNSTDPDGLRRAAAPFTYVGGAIRPDPWNGPVKSLRTNELAAVAQFYWTAVPGQFLDSEGCVLCDVVGVAQIERSSVRYSGTLYSSYYSWVNSHDWRVDYGIPFPYARGQNVIQSPAANGSATVGLFQDDPGGLPAVSYLFGVLESAEHDFEMHFICLSGAEAGAVYGGYEWGYSFALRFESAARRGDLQKGYQYERYARPIQTPSDTFKHLVRQWLLRKAVTQPPT